MMIKTLKGDTFINRYRFTGKLITRSPLHIGTGESSINVYSGDEQKRLKEKIDKVPEVSTIIRDFQGKPLIPGSTIRGVTRHWLLNLLTTFGPEWAADRDYEAPTLTSMNQAEQISTVKQDFSWLELLFGTPFHEGKIEFWDAKCLTGKLNSPDSLLGWNPNSLTYIDTSVAINPATGTAIENLLYKIEVVPTGVEFEFNLAGQNLSDFEIGLLLLALQGFNSKIFPIRIGSRGGRGFGLMQYKSGDIFGLTAADLPEWVASVVNSYGNGNTPEEGNSNKENAGYFALPKLGPDEQEKLITSVKKQLTEKIRSDHG